MGRREKMDIPEKHKQILNHMGIDDNEFTLFDGKTVIYEYDHERGVRIYDPYYKTSTNRYIGVDGWTSWSSEDDEFLNQLFPNGPPRPAEAIVEATGEKALKKLKEKFGKGSS